MLFIIFFILIILGKDILATNNNNQLNSGLSPFGKIQGPKLSTAIEKRSPIPFSGLGELTFKKNPFTLQATIFEMCESYNGTYFFQWFTREGDSQVLGAQVPFSDGKLIKDWSTDNEFKVLPYTMDFGIRDIAVHLGIMENGTYKIVADEKCTIHMRVDGVKAAIKGGRHIYVKSNQSFVTDASISRNLNLKHAGDGLTYEWILTVVKGDTTTASVVVPGSSRQILTLAKFVTSGSTFRYSLTVKSNLNLTGIDDRLIETTLIDTVDQIIEVKDNAVEISITCKKNCPPASDITRYGDATIFEAQCSLCDVNEQGWTWHMENAPYVNYDKMTKGQHQRIFQINSKTLEMEITYIIRVTLGGKHIGSADIEIRRSPEPHLRNCYAFPSSGVAAETLFGLSCFVASPYPVKTVEIHYTTGGKDILITNGKSIYDIRFKLPEPTEQITVVVKDINNSKTNQSMPLHVVRNNLHKMTDEEQKKYIKDIYLNKDKSPQNLLIGAKQLKHMNLTDEDEQPIELLEDINYTNLTTSEQGTIIAQVAKTMLEMYKNNSKPSISQAATSVCKNLAKIVQDEQKSNPNQGGNLDSFSQTIAECLDSGSIPNDKVLESVPLDIEIKDPGPNDVNSIAEYYQDYRQDDEHYGNAIHKLGQAADSITQTCFISAQSTAGTMVPEEATVRHTSGGFEITATKKYGRYYQNFSLTVLNVTLQPPQDFVRSAKDIFEIYMCTSIKNPYWFVKEEKPCTPVTFLEFYGHGRKLETFNKPFELSFQTNKTEIDKLDIDVEVHIPNVTLESIKTTKELYKWMAVYRIEVPKNSMVKVVFQKLTNEDCLDVIFTDFYKPTLEYFRKNFQRIRLNNTVVSQKHAHDYDCWHYLGVLLSPGSKSNKSYIFRTYSLSCISWNSNSNTWNSSCLAQESSNFEEINCDCYHTTTFAGSVKQCNVKLEEEQVLKFQLEYQICHIVVITLGALFGLYCILFCVASLKTETSFLEKVFFLSDVPYNFQFGYLIIITTGNKKRTGTTSNVVIRLIGQALSSKPYVLNYPDPEMQMLQKNTENWFVLATENYLGDIKQIEVWFDAIGCHPNWYLSSMTIYDMQQEKSWFFDIKQWFYLTKQKENVFFTFTPADETSRKPKTRFFKFKKRVASYLQVAAFGPHMWNIMYNDEALPKIQKITIIYSIILSTFSVQLLFYGIPRFDDSDSIGRFGNYGFFVEMVWIVLVSLLSVLLLHFPLVYFFRKCNKRYLDEEDRFSNEKYEELIVNICWCFLTLNIICCMVCLLVIGYFIPCLNLLLWLTTVIVSIIVYVVIFENILRRIFYMIFGKTKVDVTKRMKIVRENINKQRSYFYKRFGTDSFRKYYTHLYEPLNEQKKRDRKEWIVMKRRIIEMLGDLIMILVYVALLYGVILTDREGSKMIYHTKHFKSMIAGLEPYGYDRIRGLYTLSELIKYFRYIVIPCVNGHKWYGKYEFHSPGKLFDLANNVLGIVRLRQHRVHNKSCIISESMKYLNMTCRPKYSVSSAEEGDFQVGWSKSKIYFPNSRLSRVWTYSEQTGASRDTGTFYGVYPGGGYVAYLGRTRTNSLINLQYYEDFFWLDLNTRVVFVEFLVYNPNVNLFLSSSLRFEHGATGYFTQLIRAYTAKLLYIRSEISLMEFVVFIAFLVVFIILILKIFFKIGVRTREFYKDPWLIIDILIVCLNIAMVVIYIRRPILVQSYLEKLSKHNNNEFVEYFNLFYLEDVFTIAAAFLVFSATLRLCRLLKFLKMFKIINTTLMNSAIPVLALLFCHAVIMFGFTVTGVILLGDQSHHFKSDLDAVALLLLLFGQLNKAFRAVIFKRPLEKAYYICFMLSSLLINTLYVTIILIYYNRATVKHSNEAKEPVIKYLKEQYAFYTSYFRVKLAGARVRGGGAEKETFSVGNAVIPKSDQHRYAEVMTVSSKRMRAMHLVARCVLRNSSRAMAFTQSDYDLMRETVMALLEISKEEDETEKFFVDKRTKKIIDNKKMSDIEQLVEELLLGKEKTTRSQVVKRFLKERLERLNILQKNLDHIKNTVKGIILQAD